MSDSENEDFIPLTEEECIEFNRRLAQQFTQRVTFGVVTAAAAGLTYDQLKKRQRRYNIQSNH